MINEGCRPKVTDWEHLVGQRERGSISMHSLPALAKGACLGICPFVRWE